MKGKLMLAGETKVLQQHESAGVIGLGYGFRRLIFPLRYSHKAGGDDDRQLNSIHQICSDLFNRPPPIISV